MCGANKVWHEAWILYRNKLRAHEALDLCTHFNHNRTSNLHFEERLALFHSVPGFFQPFSHLLRKVARLTHSPIRLKGDEVEGHRLLFMHVMHKTLLHASRVHNEAHTAFSCPSEFLGSSDMAVNSWNVSCQNFLLGISCRTLAVSTGLLASTDVNPRSNPFPENWLRKVGSAHLMLGKTCLYAAGTRISRLCRIKVLLKRLARTERSPRMVELLIVFGRVCVPAKSGVRSEEDTCLALRFPVEPSHQSLDSRRIKALQVRAQSS